MMDWGAFYSPGKRPGTHCAGGWVGLGDNLAPLRFDPRTFQPVGSRYSVCTIPTDIRSKDWKNYVHSAVRIHS